MEDLSEADQMTAWQQTVADHGGWLRSLIASRLDPGEPVDDVLQDTLRSAIDRGRPEEPMRDVKGWLAGIARNKVRQHIDRNCRERRMQERLASEEMAMAPVPVPDQLLIARERLDLVRRALASLEPETAALLRDKYVKGWSYAKIGGERGWNEDAVTNRLRQARRLLRENIQRLTKQSENHED